MEPLAKALLHAHIEHELNALTGDELSRRLEHRVLTVCSWFSEVTLDDVVTPQQIVGIVDRYAIDLRYGAGVAELAGEIARIIFRSHSTANTRLEQVLASDAYDEYADKVTDLDAVRREVIHLLTRSSGFATAVARVLSQAVAHLLFAHRAHAGAPAPRRALVQRLQRIADRISPWLVSSLETCLVAYLERHAAFLARQSETVADSALDMRTLRGLADELWNALSQMRLDELFSLFDADDVEEFVVLGYEFWLRFRKTPYFHEMVEQVVASVFDKYGHRSVASFLADMGITEAMILNEAKLLLTPFYRQAVQSGLAEQLLRARLEEFYRSQAVAALLAQQAHQRA